MESTKLEEQRDMRTVATTTTTEPVNNIMLHPDEIFRRPIPVDIVFGILDTICLKTDKFYLVDETAYQQLLFRQLNEVLVQNVVDYYHASKQFYVCREMTYSSFLNFIRQFCKSNGVPFARKIHYRGKRSIYTAEYWVYFV